MGRESPAGDSRTTLNPSELPAEPPPLISLYARSAPGWPGQGPPTRCGSRQHVPELPDRRQFPVLDRYRPEHVFPHLGDHLTAVTDRHRVEDLRGVADTLPSTTL